MKFNRSILAILMIISGLLGIQVTGEDPPVPKTEAQTETMDIEPFNDLEHLDPWDISTGIATEDFSNWTKGFHHIQLVTYDDRVEPRRPLVKEGRIHKGVMQDLTKTLSAADFTILEKLVTGKHPTDSAGMCYEPHHGLIFFDKDNKILGHLEVCLLCRRYESNPRIGPPAQLNYKGLKEFISGKGLPVFETLKQWEAFFEEKASTKGKVE